MSRWWYAAALALAALSILTPSRADAQAAARAPDWAQALLVTDVDAVTVSRPRLQAPEGGLAVRMSVAPAQGGVARLIRYQSDASGAALSLWRFTGHNRNGWVLWGGEAPVPVPLSPAQRTALERTARAALSAGALGGESGLPSSPECGNGDFAWIEIADSARSATFERRCAMDGASGALVRALVDLTGNRDEEELFQAGVNEVLAADKAFAAAVASDGLGPALATFASEEGRLFPGGAPPVQGREALAAIASDPEGGLLSWSATGAEVSARGDMAWSWGQWKRTLPGREGGMGAYVAVWRRDPGGEWRYVGFMLN